MRMDTLNTTRSWGGAVAVAVCRTAAAGHSRIHGAVGIDPCITPFIQMTQLKLISS